MKNTYEGDEKVEEARLQIFIAKLEQLNTNEDEYITNYFLRVDELVNSIKGLRDEIKESIVVKNLLRSLSM
jgi:hypothetical protein